MTWIELEVLAEWELIRRQAERAVLQAEGDVSLEQRPWTEGSDE